MNAFASFLITVIILMTFDAFNLPLNAQQHVFFATQDNGRVSAQVYGKGNHGVILVHGGRFNKESWADQANVLASKGFLVAAIDLRGYGSSTGPGPSDPYSAPFYQDVLAAVRYLRSTGSTTISVIGASMGGWAAADASIHTPGEIDRIVILAASVDSPGKLTGRKLFIVAQGDTTASGIPRLVQIRKDFEQAPKPKALVVLNGTAHAQYIFDSPQSEDLMKELLKFLSEP